MAKTNDQGIPILVKKERVFAAAEVLLGQGAIFTVTHETVLGFSICFRLVLKFKLTIIKSSR